MFSHSYWLTTGRKGRCAVHSKIEMHQLIYFTITANQCRGARAALFLSGAGAGATYPLYTFLNFALYQPRERIRSRINLPSRSRSRIQSRINMMLFPPHCCKLNVYGAKCCLKGLYEQYVKPQYLSLCA
jgi:hypothetical protein